MHVRVHRDVLADRHTLNVTARRRKVSRTFPFLHACERAARTRVCVAACMTAWLCGCVATYVPVRAHTCAPVCMYVNYACIYASVCIHEYPCFGACMPLRDAWHKLLNLLQWCIILCGMHAWVRVCGRAGRAGGRACMHVRVVRVHVPSPCRSPQRRAARSPRHPHMRPHAALPWPTRVCVRACVHVFAQAGWRACVCVCVFLCVCVAAHVRARESVRHK